ncbi:alpha/beta hydrolase [Dyella monticola]|uniref:Alpha/beta hydrolase n=1 Tax=Dyella monticola TaxID=1927958 RepID=A0A370X564_9GAMM|nr:alpha/beta hydrolase [Dyella monticola]RDS83528.1 alpha/beta hydrolase [Dyella monticola]
MFGLSVEALLEKAQSWETDAIRAQSAQAQAYAWLQCATLAHDAMRATEAAKETAAGLLATQCSRAFFDLVAQGGPIDVAQGRTTLEGIPVRVEFRGMPDSLGKSAYLEPADQVSMLPLANVRYHHAGFGVPLVAFALPCSDRAICRLYPPEGVFRPATLWLEAASGTGAYDDMPVLVLQNPVLQPEHTAGTNRYELAEDASAPYAQLLERTRLKRLAWWGMIGGAEVGKRSGLFLLDDYDPNKIPIIMIHGVAGSPLIWARLSNAIMGDPELHRRYQIWHIVYQSNAPLLVERYRVQHYIDEAWSVLDPSNQAPARRGVVLIGHSMGGVIARLLCAQSTPAVWSAAFTEPLEGLHADAADLRALKDIFEFEPYPGVNEIIFMAAPQRGSPAAEGLLGRMVGLLAWRNIEEMAAVMRIVGQNPKAIQPALQAMFKVGHITSITSLRPDEPVTLADEKLMPAPGVRYDTIAGVLPGITPPGDGYVPLSSALLPGSTTTLIIRSDHKVPDRPEAIADVLKILRAHAKQIASTESLSAATKDGGSP